MSSAHKERDFGTIRQLASGRWQARYRGPDGVRRSAPVTFRTKTDAKRWLNLKEAEIARGEWISPEAGGVLFGAYVAEWMQGRDVSPKTEQLYEGLLRLHLLPTFAESAISDIREGDVRKWRTARLKGKVGRVTVAKAYRLLRAILNTAVRDELIRKNPCRIEGADQEKSPERPVLSVPEVFKLADAIAPRYRALVLLATFGSLWWGELTGLRRRNLDLKARTVTVSETMYDLATLVPGTPKSDAGYRTVQLPALVVPALEEHLDRYAQSGRDGVHFHDLRHTGNTYAAEAGASLRELMNRMGHSSTRAALGYLHARDSRARQLADALGERAAQALLDAASTEEVAKQGGDEESQ